MRVAVAGATLVALVSLVRHAPLSLAALRGGATLVALLVALRLGLAALEHAAAQDRAARRRAEGERS
jgi:hypothetical protein